MGTNHPLVNDPSVRVGTIPTNMKPIIPVLERLFFCSNRARFINIVSIQMNPQNLNLSLVTFWYHQGWPSISNDDVQNDLAIFWRGQNIDRKNDSYLRTYITYYKNPDRELFHQNRDRFINLLIQNCYHYCCVFITVFSHFPKDRLLKHRLSLS